MLRTKNHDQPVRPILVWSFETTVAVRPRTRSWLRSGIQGDEHRHLDERPDRAGQGLSAGDPKPLRWPPRRAVGDLFTLKCKQNRDRVDLDAVANR